MKRLAAIAAGAALLTGAPAHAGSIYFHQPGIARDRFVADATECEQLAAGVYPPRQVQPYQANPYAAGTAAFLAGLMRGRERRGMIDSILRTCMLDKGYRRVDAAAVERALDHLPDDQRIDRLASLAAASTPQGKVLPR